MNQNNEVGWMVVAVLLLCGSCASTSDGTSVNIVDDIRLMSMSDEGLSPSEAQLLEAAKRNATTRIEGASIGAVGGCLVGFLGGRAFTDDTAVVAGTTAGGCVAGGLAGYAAGSYVAEVNAQAAGQQANLQDRIDAANADAARYREAANAAERTVAELRTEIGSLNQRYAAGQITAAEYADQLGGVESSALSLRVLIVESLGNIEVMEQDIAALEQNGRDTSALKQRLATLRAENQRLAAQYEDLAQVVDLVPAGVDAPTVRAPAVA
jgi:cell division protein FtsB